MLVLDEILSKNEYDCLVNYIKDIHDWVEDIKGVTLNFNLDDLEDLRIEFNHKGIDYKKFNDIYYRLAEKYLMDYSRTVNSTYFTTLWDDVEKCALNNVENDFYLIPSNNELSEKMLKMCNKEDKFDLMELYDYLCEAGITDDEERVIKLFESVQEIFFSANNIKECKKLLESFKSNLRDRFYNNLVSYIETGSML